MNLFQKYTMKSTLPVNVTVPASSLSSHNRDCVHLITVVDAVLEKSKDLFDIEFESIKDPSHKFVYRISYENHCKILQRDDII